jgi:hypothetical protein
MNDQQSNTTADPFASVTIRTVQPNRAGWQNELYGQKRGEGGHTGTELEKEFCDITLAAPDNGHSFTEHCQLSLPCFLQAT